MPRGRRQGPLKDWVQNFYTYEWSTGQTLVAGPLNQQGHPLTFSDQVRILETSGDEQLHSWGSIPEGKGARTYAVRGHILIRPVVWATPAAFGVVFRIGVYTQDINNLGAIVASTHTLMDGGEAAVYADEPFAWQLADAKASNNLDDALPPFFVYEVNATVNRRLNNDEALFIISESMEGSVDINVRYLLRTLVAVD